MTAPVAILTGGTGALGQSITAALLVAGGVVAIPYAVPEEAKRLEARLSPDQRARVLALPADVTDEASLGKFVQVVGERHGRVDGLVNAVGGFAGGDLVSTPLPEWERMMKLNLTSAVIACRAVLPGMIEARRGRIVNIASRAVLPPQGGFIAYTVSKAAVITLTQALAQEVKPHGVAVNAVLPSTMDTPANRRAMPDADRSGWVSTDAVAGVVAFLLSDRGAAVTGSAVTV
ncbi:MAG TPA: SDR family NAD(P)-dependent oxidoreductase [Candidatus Dormibacteraeota bacterium]|nr:SDR family NAD(P)-dependent oxidoreductase [Candidatus Dormibacteraeota bacterium]